MITRRLETLEEEERLFLKSHDLPSLSAVHQWRNRSNKQTNKQVKQTNKQTNKQKQTKKSNKQTKANQKIKQTKSHDLPSLSAVHQWRNRFLSNGQTNKPTNKPRNKIKQTKLNKQNLFLKKMIFFTIKP